jgi:hypothetical protein
LHGVAQGKIRCADFFLRPGGMILQRPQWLACAERQVNDRKGDTQHKQPREKARHPLAALSVADPAGGRQEENSLFAGTRGRYSRSKARSMPRNTVDMFHRAWRTGRRVQPRQGALSIVNGTLPFAAKNLKLIQTRPPCAGVSKRRSEPRRNDAWKARLPAACRATKRPS